MTVDFDNKEMQTVSRCSGVVFLTVAQLLAQFMELALSSQHPEPPCLPTTTACIGHTAELRCQTSLSKSVDITFQRNCDGDEPIVHDGNIIYSVWEKRSNFTQHSNGTNVLRIFSVQLADVGFYHCIENVGLGKRTWFFLNVTECSTTHGIYSIPDNSTISAPCSCHTYIVLVIVLTFIVVVLAVVLILIFLCPRKSAHCCEGLRREDCQLEVPPQTPESQCLNSREEQSRTPIPSSISSNSSNSDATDVMFLEPVGETCRGERVRSVCVVDDRLYVARFKQPIIEVYDTPTMEQVDKLLVAGDGHAVPTSLAADEADKVLYVAYHKEKTMQTHILSDKSKMCTNWALHDKPDSISVTPDRTILVTFTKATMLAEYQRDGTMIRCIHLGLGIVHPCYAISIIKNTFVVCYGKLGKTRCDMCLVNSDGNIIHHVGTKTTLPQHVSVGPGRNLFVCDYNDGNVVVLDKNFQNFITVLDKFSGINQPFTSCLDNSRQHIYIGEVSEVPGDSRVMSFKVCYRPQIA